jgi:hypothetical protein
MIPSAIQWRQSRGSSRDSHFGQPDKPSVSTRGPDSIDLEYRPNPVAPSQQLARHALSFAHVSKTRNAAAVIEVRADADVINADHFHRRIDRIDGVGYRRISCNQRGLPATASMTSRSQQRRFGDKLITARLAAHLTRKPSSQACDIGAVLDTFRANEMVSVTGQRNFERCDQHSRT